MRSHFKFTHLNFIWEVIGEVFRPLFLFEIQICSRNLAIALGLRAILTSIPCKGFRKLGGVSRPIQTTPPEVDFGKIIGIGAIAAMKFPSNDFRHDFRLKMSSFFIHIISIRSVRLRYCGKLGK